jgi:hypothetical protein
LKIKNTHLEMIYSNNSNKNKFEIINSNYFKNKTHTHKLDKNKWSTNKKIRFLLKTPLLNYLTLKDPMHKVKILINKN